ncbi:MAG TPA: hypothetical protein VN641_21915 [Urbifossiella sp.]|jgi:hypothetical protein|nr:hypothetical protein [Urbifossiella sp.]
MSTTKTQTEFRTAAQIRADEEIAADAERYLVKDSATGWMIPQATDERRNLAEANANEVSNAVAAGGLNVPFLWNGKAFRIVKASHCAGSTIVESQPRDAAFEAELRRRIDAVPFHVLTFFQGFGYVCFPEDFARYQG